MALRMKRDGGSGTHRLLHANSRSIGVVEGGRDLLVEGRSRLHVEVSC